MCTCSAGAWIQPLRPTIAAHALPFVDSGHGISALHCRVTKSMCLHPLRLCRFAVQKGDTVWQVEPEAVLQADVRSTGSCVYSVHCHPHDGVSQQGTLPGAPLSLKAVLKAGVGAHDEVGLMLCTPL